MSFVKIDYRLLGARDHYAVLGKNKKRDDIKNEAFKEIKKYFQSNQEGKNIFDLIHAVFSNEPVPFVGHIQEAIKSNSLFSWTACLSATGNQILAMLAVLADEDFCTDKTAKKKLNIDALKIKILSFFTEETANQIYFDDNALQAFKSDYESGVLNKTIREIKNLLPKSEANQGIKTIPFVQDTMPSANPLFCHELKKKVIETERDHMGSVRFFSSETRQPSAISPPIELAFVNSSRGCTQLLHQLVETGVFKITDEDRWAELKEQIGKDSYDIHFIVKLKKALAPNGSTSKIIFFDQLIKNENMTEHSSRLLHLLNVFSYVFECYPNTKIISVNVNQTRVAYFNQNQGQEKYATKHINYNFSPFYDSLTKELNDNEELRSLYEKLMKFYLQHQSFINKADDKSKALYQQLIQEQKQQKKENPTHPQSTFFYVLLSKQKHEIKRPYLAKKIEMPLLSKF